MLLAAEMGPVVARSSLERMLDSIRLREERPEGSPPALPARPTSRGRRLPSSLRPMMPVQLKAGSVAPVRCKGTAYAEMPRLESYEDRSEGDDGSISPPEAKLEWGDDTDRVLKKIAAAGDTGNQTLQGILWIQKRFRGHQARCHFQELKRGVTTLQSYVRAERARRGFDHLAKMWKAAVLIQKHAKRWIARKTFDGQRKNIIFTQSVIRGWLARRDFMVLKNLEKPRASHVNANKDPGKNLQKMEDVEKDHPQVCPSVFAELQSRVLQAETALRHKDEENVMLQQQLQQYETRWSEYEEKMKSMERMWQKQLTSLQKRLAAAKKSLVADDIADRPGRLDASSDLYFDSEDTMSVEIHTPESTPTKQPRSSDARVSRNSDGTTNAVSYLIKEFEERRQVFEDDAGLLIDTKSEKSVSITHPDEELHKLKVSFDAWRKDYKDRLRETKVALRKVGKSEPKTRRRWWASGCTR